VEVKVHGNVALLPAEVKTSYFSLYRCPYCGASAHGLSTTYVQVIETTSEEFEDQDDLLDLEDTNG
jgi:hypothetical protein